jgi:hypothetical protein
MKRSTKIRICHRGAPMLFYPAALPLSAQTLTYVAGIIRCHRRQIGSCWRKLSPGRQSLLVLAYLRKGETFAELAAGIPRRRARQSGCADRLPRAGTGRRCVPMSSSPLHCQRPVSGQSPSSDHAATTGPDIRLHPRRHLRAGFRARHGGELDHDR